MGLDMQRAIWMAAGMALVLMAGCQRTMSYGDLDATRVNAINALNQSNEVADQISDLEARVYDLEGQVAVLEANVSNLYGQ